MAFNLEQIKSMLMFHPDYREWHKFSKSVSARRKWIVTRSVLNEPVSHLIESQDWKITQMTSRQNKS